MSFQPVVPMTGYSGWIFLNRTMEPQKEAYLKSAVVQRDMDYFRENIAKAKTPEDLVGDRRLMSVALEAFGLEEDLYAKALVKKVLEEGTLAPDAFANRMSDKRYKSLALAFGYGDLGARTGLAKFADEILDRFKEKSFARAVGEVDNSMRLALNVESSMGDIADSAATDSAQWFAMMGDSPLRQVFETALGLPPSFGAIDLDQQLDTFRDRARSTFGSDKFADLTTEENREKLIRLFLVRNEAQQSSISTGASVALSLLSSFAPTG